MDFFPFLLLFSITLSISYQILVKLWSSIRLPRLQCSKKQEPFTPSLRNQSIKVIPFGIERENNNNPTTTTNPYENYSKPETTPANQPWTVEQHISQGQFWEHTVTVRCDSARDKQ